MTKSITREEWLNKVATLLRPVFKKEANIILPKNIRISCSFPSSGARGKAIGECWYEQDGNGMHEIFISPRQFESARVADILAHELIHATLGQEAGHGPDFKKAALAIGLEGKMTATSAGEKFIAIYENIIKKIGQSYPHDELMVGGSPTKKQPWNAHVNLRCPDEECDYYMRTTLECFMRARPHCPCCGKGMMTKKERKSL